VVSGFSVCEDWGTWTCASRSTLRVALAAPVRAWVSLALEYRFGQSLLADANSAVVVSVNGQPSLRMRGQHDSYSLQLALWREGPGVTGRDDVEIAFAFEGLHTPRELGMAPEDRLVGLGLISLTVDFA